MTVPMNVVLGLSALLFAIGAFGFLARRNIILMFISVEVMLNAVNLSLVGFSWHMGDPRGHPLLDLRHLLAHPGIDHVSPQCSQTEQGKCVPRTIAASPFRRRRRIGLALCGPMQGQRR